MQNAFKVTNRLICIMLKRGIRDGIPIALGYFSVSFSFGILAVANGFSVLETLLISITNLTSAGQFAGITVMATMGSFIEMAVTQFVINLRYSLMAISLSQKVDSKFTGIYRAILGVGITDEIFAVAMGNRNEVSRRYFLGLMTLPYLCWSFGTLAGAVCGNVLPKIVCDSLGIALYGMFIAIVVPDMKKDMKKVIVVFTAIAISCILYYIPLFKFVSSGFAVIISAIAASLVGAYLSVKDKKTQTDSHTKVQNLGENIDGNI